MIVNIASMYGTLATSLNTPAVAYTAAKHGVVGLTRADAIAYAPKGIRINAICPGYVTTPLIQNAMASTAIQNELAKVPAGRFAEVDEMADHISFLASPMSSYMYGAAMLADGYVSYCQNHADVQGLYNSIVNLNQLIISVHILSLALCCRT